MGSERSVLGSERPDLVSERPDLGSKGLHLQSGRLVLRLGGGTYVRKPEKIALCGIIGHRPLRGRYPKKGKKSQKRYMVSGTRCPYVGVCGDEMRGAAAPEGPMTYDST